MPKIFVLRHQLAEQQARLDRDRLGQGGKEGDNLSPTTEEVTSFSK